MAGAAAGSDGAAPPNARPYRLGHAGGVAFDDGASAARAYPDLWRTGEADACGEPAADQSDGRDQHQGYEQSGEEDIGHEICLLAWRTLKSFRHSINLNVTVFLHVILHFYTKPNVGDRFNQAIINVRRRRHSNQMLRQIECLLLSFQNRDLRHLKCFFEFFHTYHKICAERTRVRKMLRSSHRSKRSLTSGSPVLCLSSLYLLNFRSVVLHLRL